jgi:hypothetical protein
MMGCVLMGIRGVPQYSHKRGVFAAIRSLASHATIRFGIPTQMVDNGHVECKFLAGTEWRPSIAN